MRRRWSIRTNCRCVGVDGNTIVPGCIAHADCQESHDLFGWFMSAARTARKIQPMSDADIIRCWFGWHLSSPSVLARGDVETSGPADWHPAGRFINRVCSTAATPKLLAYSGKMPAASVDRMNGQSGMVKQSAKSPEENETAPRQTRNSGDASKFVASLMITYATTSAHQDDLQASSQAPAPQEMKQLPD